jgi:hypothetical protein
MKPFSVWTLGVFILVLWSGASGETQEVIEGVGNGEINWSQGIILAKGSGAPPKEARNIAQARLMTERAALADARRNLLEVLKGVRVDSSTLVENFMAKDDQIRLQAEGFIQGSLELRSLRRYLSDGAIEVTVAMNLSGDFLALLLRRSALSAEPRPEKRALSLEPLPPVKEPILATPPVLPPAEKKAEPSPSVVAGPGRPIRHPVDLPQFTGVVIDARGLGVKPALIIRVLDEKGVELYRGQYVPQEKAARNGLALFSRDLTAAQTNPRVGKKPLTVKGLRVDPSKPADIILSGEEAEKIAPYARKGTFLEDCRVMIVLG